MKTVNFLLIVFAIGIFSFKVSAQAPAAVWVAPATANSTKNPLAGNAQALAEGKKLYVQMCTVCHGEKGDGLGPAGASLKPKAANFTSPKVQGQTDGAIFWKLSEGKGAMASYKNILTATQRWQLVNYIRSFKKK